MSTGNSGPLLAVRGVRKRFGTVQALADVDLDFEAGEIHAVLGENGAGKSTLMHLLAGVHRPDAGSILLDGWPTTFASPRAARRAGIGMVHQHFTLVEALSVVENLALSLPDQPRWRFDAAAAARHAQTIAARIGLDLGAPDMPVSELPVGARQRLEILKALAAGGRVLILDEPTAVLTPQEVRQLFVMLRQLRAQDRLILFITHKLREVTEIADRLTVMRRGRVILTRRVNEITESEMAEAMVGELTPARPRPARATSAARVALSVSGLRVSEGSTAALSDATFDVRAGEVFGIAGVDGNGQRELFEVLVGLRRPAAGRVCVGDRAVAEFDPRAALAAGIGHIPPDRQREGLILAMTVQENLLLNRALLERFSRRGLLQHNAARTFAAQLAQQYAIQYADLDAPVRGLSGGNQQRVVVARELAQQPHALIAVNPTRGLDVAAAAAVSGALLDVAEKGCAIVLISTDLDEVLELSDRVSVLFRGRLSPALDPPVDRERLGLLMAGVGI
jgi:general nucleoside transport system ATP-binding protein